MFGGAFETKEDPLPRPVYSVGTHSGFIFETRGFIFEMEVSFLKWRKILTILCAAGFTEVVRC